ncbi:hypothetical protein [Agromyces arachidis]|uniref:hypothetical protein n=1 Tax=Agromyces arachidis TaxID=766966 RepID=UPI0040566929
MRSIHAAAAGLGLAGAVLLALASPFVARSDPPDELAEAPLPVFVDGAEDPAKSMIVRVDFASRTEATLTSAEVSIERAHTHVGDPPLLRLVVEDADGATIRTLNAWSPLWTFTWDDSERLEIRESGAGTFIVPFSPEMAQMRVLDIALDEEVLAVDLAAPVRDFCIATPDDPDCVEADLAVTGLDVSVPRFGIVGDVIEVAVASEIANLGPDGPVDAEVTRSSSAGAGLTVDPAGDDVVDVAAIPAGGSERLDAAYTVGCVDPGRHELTFRTAIAPERASVIDPDPDNDAAEATVVVDCALPVSIDVVPGSPTNPVRLNGGVVPVALLTTAAGEDGATSAFDAVLVEPSSLRFGSLDALLDDRGVGEAHGAVHPADSDGDGDLDALLHFGPRVGALSADDTEACVFGRTDEPSGSVAFVGCDAVAPR